MAKEIKKDPADYSIVEDHLSEEDIEEMESAVEEYESLMSEEDSAEN